MKIIVFFFYLKFIVDVIAQSIVHKVSIYLKFQIVTIVQINGSVGYADFVKIGKIITASTVLAFPKVSDILFCLFKFFLVFSFKKLLLNELFLFLFIFL